MNDPKAQAAYYPDQPPQALVPAACLPGCYQDGETEPYAGRTVVTAVWIVHDAGCPNAAGLSVPASPAPWPGAQ